MEMKIRQLLDSTGTKYKDTHNLKIMSALASSILHVVKRSGKRQKYTNNKIVRHLNELARKRPVLAEISANEISNRATSVSYTHLTLPTKA